MTTSQLPQPIQEFDIEGKHRLVSLHSDSKTSWAGYTQITFLDGWVGHTAYHGKSEAVVSPEEFVGLIAVKDFV